MEFLDAVLGLVAIDSVAMLEVSEQAPYGAGPAEALAYTLALCEKLGIRTENMDGKIAWAEIGAGDEIVGVLGHLDVVPAGDGWAHNSKGERCGDRLYGRGVADDKGPTLAALYAMKELQDAHAPLKRRVRLIFGQSEETGGWDDMELYKKTQQLPVFGFTPDADFPAIYGEKGILNFELSMPLSQSGLLRAEGGDAGNMVPDWCNATIAGDDGPIALVAKGRSADASTPEKGQNAISNLMDRLSGPFAAFYNQHIGFDYHGGKMGCGFEDAQSGNLTLNAGVLRTVGDNLVLTVDIRNPVSFTSDQVQQAIEKACAPYDIAVRCTENTDSIYMDQDGAVIRAMLSVYREVTGDDSEPTVIGGGTYARAMPGIVAFGPMRPGRACTEHQKDEYMLVEDLLSAKEIYRRTIEKLANLEDVQ